MNSEAEGEEDTEEISRSKGTGRMVLAGLARFKVSHTVVRTSLRYIA